MFCMHVLSIKMVVTEIERKDENIEELAYDLEKFWANYISCGVVIFWCRGRAQKDYGTYEI